MKSKITIINIALISIAAIATVLSAYNIVPISHDVLLIIRWLAVAGLITFAIIKKNLTTSILIAMLVGTEIGHDFPDMGISLHFLRQTQPVGIIFTQSQKKELNYYYVA